MSVTNVEAPHNTNALFLGTAEFRFCKGATSAANAAVLGYRDIGNIKAFQPSTEIKVEDHKGANRGTLKVDKRTPVSSAFTYKITTDELNRKNALLAFGGLELADLTQVAGSTPLDAFMDILDFTTNHTDDGLNFQLYRSGIQIYAPLSVTAWTTVAAQACSGANSGDLFTLTAHGYSIGDIVYFTGTGLSTNLVAGQSYYVKTVPTSSTFTISATLGGSTFAISSDSTNQFVQKAVLLVSGTDFVFDPEMGSIRFLTTRTTLVQVAVLPDDIASGSGNSVSRFVPLGELKQEGYGWFTSWDSKSDDRLVTFHGPFACSITPESLGEFNGTSWTEVVLNLQVLPSDLGVIGSRHANGVLTS